MSEEKKKSLKNLFPHITDGEGGKGSGKTLDSIFNFDYSSAELRVLSASLGERSGFTNFKLDPDLLKSIMGEADSEEFYERLSISAPPHLKLPREEFLLGLEPGSVTDPKQGGLLIHFADTYLGSTDGFGHTVGYKAVRTIGGGYYLETSVSATSTKSQGGTSKRSAPGLGEKLYLSEGEFNGLLARARGKIINLQTTVWHCTNSSLRVAGITLEDFTSANYELVAICSHHRSLAEVFIETNSPVVGEPWHGREGVIAVKEARSTAPCDIIVRDSTPFLVGGLGFTNLETPDV